MPCQSQLSNGRWAEGGEVAGWAQACGARSLARTRAGLAAVRSAAPIEALALSELQATSAGLCTNVHSCVGSHSAPAHSALQRQCCSTAGRGRQAAQAALCKPQRRRVASKAAGLAAPLAAGWAHQQEAAAAGPGAPCAPSCRRRCRRQPPPAAAMVARSGEPRCTRSPLPASLLLPEPPSIQLTRPHRWSSFAACAPAAAAAPWRPPHPVPPAPSRRASRASSSSSGSSSSSSSWSSRHPRRHRARAASPARGSWLNWG